MKRCALFLILVFGAAGLLGGTPAEEARQVIVLYNTAFEGSRQLANYYAEKRDIPSRNVIGLTCSPEEEISREEYDQEIAGPLRRLLMERGWWKVSSKDGRTKVRESRIRYVVLMRGMPLKIKKTVLPVWDKKSPQPPLVWSQNAASVDTELAALGTAEHDLLRGAMPNPYFQAEAHLNESLYPELLLVTRLDGPTDGAVRQMIHDTILAEEEGLRGFAYVDIRSTTKKGLTVGDDWLRAAADLLRQRGMPVVVDRNESVFPRDYPFRDVAVYLGWYSGRAVPPFGREEFRFARGAVAAHIHSFSASTIRHERDHWVGPFVSGGACATLGNVYEPYLGLTVNLDKFTQRLLDGSNFAEAGYAALPALSWMNVFVGDPLYRPFKQDRKFVSIDESVWVQASQAARAWQAGNAYDVQITLDRAGIGENRGIVAEAIALAALGRRNFDAGFAYLEEARNAYTEPADLLRITLHEVEAWRLRGDRQRAKEVVRAAMKALPDPTSDAALLLREIEFQLVPPAPAATPSPAPSP